MEPLTSDELKTIFEAVAAGEGHAGARERLPDRHRTTVCRIYNVAAEFERRGLNTLDDPTAEEIARRVGYSTDASYANNKFPPWRNWKEEKERSSGEEVLGDPDLGPHGRELFHFGRCLRDRLEVETPIVVVELMARRGQVPLWSGRPGFWAGAPRNAEEENVEQEWGFRHFDARTHALFPCFRQHLDDSPCWGLLNEAERAIGRYVMACCWAHGSIQDALDSAPLDLREADKQGMAHSLFMEVYHKVTGSGGLGISYEPAQEGGRWHLKLGAWRAGDKDTRAGLQPFADLHRTLEAGAIEWDSFETLARTHGVAREAVRAFQDTLRPDTMLRKRLLQGRCDFCP